MTYVPLQFGVEYLNSQNSGFWDSLYGMRLADECARANDEILLVVQIEHIEAVCNIDAILSVPGIDSAFIGPYDLTTSMGITG